MTFEEWKKTQSYHKAMAVCLRGVPSDIDVALELAFSVGGEDSISRVEARLSGRRESHSSWPVTKEEK